MTQEEVNKCIEYLNNETTGLAVKEGELGNPLDSTVKRWFPPELSWTEWLVKCRADMRLAGADCYKIRVATGAFVKDEYPFTLIITSAESANTFIEFKNRLLYAFEIYAKAREQQAEYLAEWKKEQIKKAAEGFEA